MNPSESNRLGLLCVVSGPSGSGKTTLCHRLSEEDELANYAISVTTRAPRDGEIDGRDYYFLSRAEFETRIANGEFIEFAQVHGNYYGTLKEEVLKNLERGQDVLIDIDVQGADQIRSHSNEIIKKAMVDIFILPPNEGELMTRLRNRGTENDAQLAIRLHNAKEEMKHWRKYQYTIISGTKDEDFDTFSAIVLGERCRTYRLQGSVEA